MATEFSTNYKGTFAKLAWRIVMQSGSCLSIYKRLFELRNDQYADFLRKHGGFQAIGEGCEINLDATILDPYLVRLGDHVSLSTCTLVGHDGSISVLNKAYNVKLESVGQIDIGDYCFVGTGAILLPGIRIGDRCVIAAGSVVTRDIPANSVVAGVPAKVVSTTDALVEKLQRRSEQLPWFDIIRNRNNGFDPELEPTLREMRISHFWGEEDGEDAARVRIGI